MTALQAIQEDLRPFPVRSSLIERYCMKYGIDANSSTSDERKISRIVVEILSQMLALNNVAEGGVSLAFDREAVVARIKRLCAEVGLKSSDYVREATVTRIE